MVCVYCSSPTRTTNSRKQIRTNTVWRRRTCSTCQAVFTTVESVDWTTALAFKSANGLEPFLRDKLFLSINYSLQHRKDALEASTALTTTVMSKLLTYVVDSSIERAQLINITCQVLKRFDKAAAVQYAAYHPL